MKVWHPKTRVIVPTAALRLLQGGPTAGRAPWGPTQANGWFPKLAPDGRHIVFGFWQTIFADLTTGEEWEVKAPTGARMIPLGWLDARTVIAVTETGPAAIYRISVDDREPVDQMYPADFAISNWGSAAFGHWGTHHGGRTYPIVDGIPFVPERTHYGLTVCGRNVVTMNPSAGYTIQHFRDGALVRELPTDNGWSVNEEGDITTGYYGDVRLYLAGETTARDATITPWRQEGPGVPVRHDGQLWLWTPGCGPVQGVDGCWIFGRRFGETDPIALPIPAVSVSAVCDGTDWIVAGNDDKGRLKVMWAPIDAPRVKFQPTIPVDPPVPPAPPEDEVPEIPKIEKVIYDKTIAAGKPWKLEAMVGSVHVTLTKDANDLLWIKAVNSAGQDAATAARRPVVVEGAAPVPPVPPEPTPPPARRVIKDVTFQCVKRGFYLTANRDMEHTPVMATATQPALWEEADVEFVDDDTVAIRWSNGRYMCAENGGGTVVHANRQQIGPWETFKIAPNGDGISLQSIDGHFLCAENGGGAAFLANRSQAGEWERFYPSKPLSTPSTPNVPGESGRVKISGSTFRAADGSVWQWKGATMFLLFWRFLNGENIDQQIAWMRAKGVNVARVLGMVHWPDVTFGPTAPNYWQRLIDFVGYMRAHGLRVEFVVFASAQDVMPNTTDQRGHLRRVVDTLGDFDNVFIEVANEPWQNGVKPWTIFAPSDVHSVPMAYGMYDFDKSKNGDVWIAKLDTLDYVTAHSPRDADSWSRKAKDLSEIRDGSGDGSENGPLWCGAKKPVVGDEPMGAAERDKVAGRQRSFRPEEFFWYHANAAINGSGSTFHCDAGLQGVVPPVAGDQERCAQAAALAWNNIPAEYQTGMYTRTGLDTLPLAWKGEQFPEQTSRIYGRLLGNRAVCIAIEPRADWTPIGINGWRVVRTIGPMNTLVFLER